MGTNAKRLVLWVCASTAIVAAAETANAAQRTESPQPTLGWSSSSSGASPRGVEAAPAPLPLLYATTEMSPESADGRARTYGARGVLELGGFASFSTASHFTSIQLSPTAGLFVFDNFEASIILGLAYVHQTIDPDTPTERSEHKTIVRVLAEPSYHLPIGPKLWAFMGVGLGAARVPRASGGTSAGLDVSPRAGLNFLIGRSGLLTPAVFIDYTTGESILSGGGSLLGVNAMYGLQAGYTVMW
jgi:hypothetical protein